MKKWVLVFVMIIVVSVSYPSRLPATAYVGLYADGERSSWCVNGEVPYTVELWVWVLPGGRGMICVEYGLSYPENVITGTYTMNPENVCSILPVIECGFPYEEDCFFECSWSWMWAMHQTIFVTDSNETMIEIIPNEYTGFLRVNNCDEGYPPEPVIKFTNLYINYEPDRPECLGTAADESSWGAIKSLYRQ